MEQLIPGISKWPKSSGGLATGWYGWAWVWFQLCEAGLIKDCNKTFQNVIAYIKKAKHEEHNSISHFGGYGAVPLICTMIYQHDSTEKRLFNKQIRTWQKAIKDCQSYDVALGHAGALLACAEIESRLPGQIPSSLLTQLWKPIISAIREIIKDPYAQFLGYSHGIAGYLYALETGRSVFGLKVPAGLRQDCKNLLWSGRINIDSRSYWPHRLGEKKVGIHGWCHGAPGVALAYLGCYLLTKESTYKDHMEVALGSSAAKITRPNLFCCGKIGQAQIFLEKFQTLNDDSHWKDMKHTYRLSLAQNEHKDDASESFFFGSLGHLYLKIRMQNIGSLPMPGFGFFSHAKFFPKGIDEK